MRALLIGIAAAGIAAVLLAVWPPLVESWWLHRLDPLLWPRLRAVLGWPQVPVAALAAMALVGGLFAAVYQRLPGRVAAWRGLLFGALLGVLAAPLLAWLAPPGLRAAVAAVGLLAMAFYGVVLGAAFKALGGVTALAQARARQQHRRRPAAGARARGA